jgi:hypothetical protein
VVSNTFFSVAAFVMNGIDIEVYKNEPQMVAAQAKVWRLFTRI